MTCFFIGRDIVGRKICIRISLAPPPVTSEPTLRLSCHVGRSGAWGLCAQLHSGEAVGVGLTLGLQRVPLSVGGYGWPQCSSGHNGQWETSTRLLRTLTQVLASGLAEIPSGSAFS